MKKKGIISKIQNTNLIKVFLIKIFMFNLV